MRKNYTVYLESGLVEQAKKIADDKWLSFSGLINKLLEACINENKNEEGTNRSLNKQRG